MRTSRQHIHKKGDIHSSRAHFAIHTWDDTNVFLVYVFCFFFLLVFSFSCKWKWMLVHCIFISHVKRLMKMRFTTWNGNECENCMCYVYVHTHTLVGRKELPSGSIIFHYSNELFRQYIAIVWSNTCTWLHVVQLIIHFWKDY